jgi:hypothetical protein
MGGVLSGANHLIHSATGIDLTGDEAARDGLAAQQAAAGDANATQKYMYDQTRSDQMPWHDAGVKALGQMQDGDYQRDFKMSDFQADPGYQFRMDEGQKALERSAAARGGLNSGGTMKALAQYSQGVASDEFNNAYNRFNADRDRRYNRLSSMAGLGQTSTAQVGQAGQNYANAYGQNVTGAANAQAAYGQQQSAQTMQMGGLALGAYGGASGWYKR